MIPVNKPLFLGRERELLIQCVDTGWLSGDGKFVSRFERLFAEYIGVKHGVAVANGTVALELALAALELPAGSGVIVPTFTIISCVTAILKNNLVPVLVDADPSTWGMDTAQVEQKLAESHVDIRAIMPVHIYGHPCDMDPILTLAYENNLKIIEDAAEAHGAEYLSGTDSHPGFRRCGCFGDLGVFSFYANKIITTGEGGMVVTGNDHLAERLRLLRNLAFTPEQRFLHKEEGFNFRMGNLHAAVGVAQMEHIDDYVRRKITQGERYLRQLSRIPGISLQSPQDCAKPVYWVNGIVLDDTVNIDAFAMSKKLHSRKIQSRPFFWPMHEQPVFTHRGLFSDERHPVSERIARRGLYLPSGMALSESQIDTVCETVEKILAG
jgi:perosamine synthetase